MPEGCLTPPQVELSLAIVTFSIAYSLCTFLIFCAVHRIAHLSMFSESRKRGLCRQNIKFLWCLFCQNWCTWGCIHPGNWQARLSFWATASWLRWCIQQFRMQRRPSVPGLWIHQIQWWPWHWGILPLQGCKWTLPIQGFKCWSQSFGLS